MSWREIASTQAQADLDGLLDTVLGFAQQQLVRHGEFFPFAAAVGNEGQVEAIAALVEEELDRPASVEVRAACFEALRSKRDTIRAGAVAADVRVHAPTAGEAIQIDLEHADGHALVVLLPYTRTANGEPPVYGELSAHAGEHRVWPIPE